MAWKGVAAYAGAVRNAVSINRNAAALVNSVVAEENQAVSILTNEVKYAMWLEEVSRKLHTSSVTLLNTLRNLKNAEERHLVDSLAIKRGSSFLAGQLSNFMVNAGAINKDSINKDFALIKNIQNRARNDVNITMKNNQNYNVAKTEVRKMWELTDKYLKEYIKHIYSGLIKGVQDEAAIAEQEKKVVALGNSMSSIFQRVKA